MLLNMMCGRRLSAISLCLAVTFAPLFNAQADEPEVIPGDSPVAVSEQGEALPQAQATAIMAGIQPLPEGAAEKARTQIESQLPAGYKPVYLNQLQLLYAARDMQPMWENRDAVKAFQQQLAEVAIAGFQPQFNKWVELLTDPGVNGMARDVVLSDAMMGYLLRRILLKILPERLTAMKLQKLLHLPKSSFTSSTPLPKRSRQYWCRLSTVSLPVTATPDRAHWMRWSFW